MCRRLDSSPIVLEIEPVSALILMFLDKGQEWTRIRNHHEGGKPGGSGKREEEIAETLEQRRLEQNAFEAA